jgi:2,4-dienoyl-CoA reductase-like NADH-dependent reductase (Old Yellow Enzyme family)
VRALAAIFQVAEVHAARGHPLHEILSPLSNRRRDAYGGSFESRTRLRPEVVATVRAVWPGGCPFSPHRRHRIGAGEQKHR